MQAEKGRQEGVTEDGLRFAHANASRTAAQILERALAHQQREAQIEADSAEASEYKDEIKASIKAWAFQARVHLLVNSFVYFFGGHRYC